MNFDNSRALSWEMPENLYDPGWNRRIIEQFLMETQRPVALSEQGSRERISTLVEQNMSIEETERSVMIRYDAQQETRVPQGSINTRE